MVTFKTLFVPKSDSFPRQRATINLSDSMLQRVGAFLETHLYYLELYF